MITFDRMKLATSSEYITNLTHHFLAILTNRNDYYYKYQQDYPFFLSIIENPKTMELVIEFTGKILKDNYPQLISRETIHQCLENINAMEICTLDIDAILNDAKVCLCDVTTDINCNYPMDEVKKHIKSSIINYDKWLVRKCQNNGLEIYNSVTTPRRFKRLIIYDKYKELQRAENRGFLESLSTPNELLNQFKCKVRIELNLRSMEQIRKYLHIDNNDLQVVLNSNSNPIIEIWDEAIAESTIANTEIYNRIEKMALLEQCNFDLQAVEMKLRANSPKNTSIRRKMMPYIQLLQSLQKDDVEQINIRNLIQ